MKDAPVLSVRDLTVTVPTARGPAEAVRGVSFEVRRGETLALVGESGCGKTLTALALLGLIDPPLAVPRGRVLVGGEDMLALPEDGRRRLRGRRIAIVFQEPATALNPVLTIGEQIDEVLVYHEGLSARAARRRTVELLGEVGLPDPQLRADDYPHRLSGGQRQRALIAMALAGRPEVLVLDEPTTALDVTVQAQVLQLLRSLRRRLGLAVVLVTHDMGVVAECADRVSVLYAGAVVEEGPVEDVLLRPLHPYTAALLRNVPDPRRRRPLAPIPGRVPRPGSLPAGCPFAPRCQEAEAQCEASEPEAVEIGDRRVRCIRRGPDGEAR